MAQHGYLGDDYGSGFDPDYDPREDRERGWRDTGQRGHWRGDQGRNWRDNAERDQFMFQSGDRSRSWNRGREGGGTFSRFADRARDWFGDDDHNDRYRGQPSGSSDAGEWFGGLGGSRQRMRGYGREHGWGGAQGEYREHRPSAHPDDHYRSWRDKQMEALDREYADYCREREHRFHSEFESWRQQRQQQSQQQQQQGGSTDQPMELTNPTTLSGETQGPQDPLSAGTLGTNNPENTAGRGRRQV